jgi:hypothetical protein
MNHWATLACPSGAEEQTSILSRTHVNKYILMENTAHTKKNIREKKFIDEKTDSIVHRALGEEKRYGDIQFARVGRTDQSRWMGSEGVKTYVNRV